MWAVIPEVWNHTRWSFNIKINETFPGEGSIFFYVLHFWCMIYICKHTALAHRLYKAVFHQRLSRFLCNP